MESLYARREERTEAGHCTSSALGSKERREQTIAARDRRAKLPRLLRGHKSYSSNVNINETNELSVMPVMTVDCCRNKRSAGFHVAVVTTRTGPALLLYR